MRSIVPLLVLFLFGCGAREETPATAQPATTATTAPAPAESAPATLAITSPADGASVSISELVRGTTAHAGRNHYIVVTPEATPLDRWVQDGPAKAADGAFSGTAQFGEGRAGMNEKFHVRVLVTASTLPAGKLADAAIPADAILSEPITVTRTR
jgi:hypothetical protein